MSHHSDTTETTEKRQITLSRKTLQNAIAAKRLEADSKYNKLQELIRSLEEHGYDETYLTNLVAATEEYKFIVNELACLYRQDKYEEFKDDALLIEEQRTINHALMIVKKIQNRQSDKLSEMSSWRSKPQSRHSRSNSSYSTSSSARLHTLAEVAAAWENAEYERAIAEKEHERNQREAEHTKDMAILTAHKNVAVANAKLEAIENAIREEENPERVEIPDIQRSDPRTGRCSFKNADDELRP